ncbi:MAG: hypothetical protein KKF89_02940 [Nanoarchaeota archaeon]|nr:hypothetical protein [Nanoarchaeota archaeon]MBU1854650.1 hypothetical protein [Nanoarchaeota archaeon]
MKKKELFGGQSHKAAIILFVSIIAIMSIYAVHQSVTNIGGQSVNIPEINCKEESYCINEEWVKDIKTDCVESEFIEYNDCTSYSFPINEEGKPDMTCNSWNTRYEEECREWSEEVEWKLECVESRIKKTCI